MNSGYNQDASVFLLPVSVTEFENDAVLTDAITTKAKPAMRKLDGVRLSSLRREENVYFKAKSIILAALQGLHIRFSDCA